MSMGASFCYLLSAWLVHLLAEGNFHIPSFLPPDARNLIIQMLAVDLLKWIMIPHIVIHPFFTTSLLPYLSPLPLPPDLVLGSLSLLIAPPCSVTYIQHSVPN